MNRKITNLVADEDTITIDLEDNSSMEFTNSIENLKNIDDLLKEQAKDRIADINNDLRESMPYNGKDAAVTLIRYATGIGAGYLGAGCGLSYITSSDPSLTKSLIVSTGVCAITFAVTYSMEKMKMAKWKYRQKSLQDEKEKLEFLADYGNQLREYPKYKNALKGLNKEQKDYVENATLPFTVLDTYKFSIEDLEGIVGKMDMERKVLTRKLRKQIDKVKEKMD
ncbi:MAG: hypothetical protein IJ193_08600 [Bacilli bacterium]|nr:hypothetical protein [Bacilli bacterium]